MTKRVDILRGNASTMDSHCGPASKIISRQHLQAKNLLSAEEYLLTSSQICESDPLVLNELGIPNQLIPLRMHLSLVSMSPPNADALSALGYIYYVKEKFEEHWVYVLTILLHMIF
ncbi:Anaphase-promoting complex subunit 6 [Gigaspora margarita]|uniref:Anaphase-promoting complex subunit 6 n=1 Tax=Gigaspora margarita TaxID=4874 RepID=A0A8H4A3G9_GIGMA|nr:Anaphase-promoting complex subunit 6 [Gigaspora margarita]